MMIWNGFFFNSPSTFLMEIIFFINDYLVIFIFSVFLLIMFNMLYLFMFNSFNMYYFDDNKLELVWTVVPSLILSFIAFPSLMSLYFMDTCYFCGFTVKVLGHQWYWSYFFPGILDLNFDSYMEYFSFIRLLEVDNNILIPCNVPIRFLISSCDVIHSWTIPSFGLKMDAVPGRVNQICFLVKKVGLFFGQCSEICGANHSFMPIVLESVPSSVFNSLILI